MVALVAAAAAVHVAAGGWLADAPVRELPDQATLVLDIFANNLLIALCPAAGGWLAAGHLLAGRRAAATAFVALGVAVAGRSLLTLAAVGGGDPAWLVDAARWWLLELAALAVSGRTGIWLVAHPELRECQGRAAMRRALAVVVAALALAACVEVLTA